MTKYVLSTLRKINEEKILLVNFKLVFFLAICFSKKRKLLRTICVQIYIFVIVRLE